MLFKQLAWKLEWARWISRSGSENCWRFRYPTKQNTLIYYVRDLKGNVCEVVLKKHEQPTCDCLHFHDCGLPCVHQIAVANRLGIKCDDWIHPHYTIKPYKKIFNQIRRPTIAFAMKTINDLPHTVKTQQISTKPPGPK